MSKFTVFRIGLALAVIATILIGYTFSEGEKISKSFDIKEKQSVHLDILLVNYGIGFYQITVSEFSRDSLLVQVLNPEHNVISDKKIETKMSVNYFDFKTTGEYQLKITNISEKPVKIQVEVGDSDSSNMRFPGIMLFVGVILMIISGYRRLRNYSIAQPDETIS